MKRVLITLGVTLAVVAGIGLAVMYTGTYDVDAMKPHGTFSRWVMRTTMEHAVRFHAEGIITPSLEDSTLIESGSEDFKEMCVQCHGSPTEGRSHVGVGLNPQAPDLSESAKKWSPAELFWITTHGIKMTGMPAFGPTHDEKALWGVVAFLKRMPGMSAEQYRRYGEPKEIVDESRRTKETHGDHKHRHP
jgi:mono/diheme cytochrome c family protein